MQPIFSIQHLEFSTQTQPGAEAVRFWVCFADQSPRCLCQYNPSQKAWYTASGFPLVAGQVLLPDADAHVLRTALFLLGVREVDDAIAALAKQAAWVNQQRRNTTAAA